MLLDEPLANLDYKLREELRAELPRIFEASGAIFVYATTEPSEALLLGGNTVCMWEGEVLQAGDTPKVYRHPDTMRVAQVFSDPPLNIVGIEKKNGAVHYAGGVRGAGHRALRGACRRRRIASAFARTSWKSPTAPPAATPFRHRHGDRDHRLGKLCASQPRRLQLGRGAAGRARIRARRRCSMRRSIPTMSSCSTRPAGWSPRRS